MSADTMVGEFVENMTSLQFVRGAIRTCHEMTAQKGSGNNKRMQQALEVLIPREQELHEKQVKLQKKGVSHLGF